MNISTTYSFDQNPQSGSLTFEHTAEIRTRESEYSPDV